MIEIAPLPKNIKAGDFRWEKVKKKGAQIASELVGSLDPVEIYFEKGEKILLFNLRKGKVVRLIFKNKVLVRIEEFVSRQKVAKKDKRDKRKLAGRVIVERWNYYDIQTNFNPESVIIQNGKQLRGSVGSGHFGEVRQFFSRPTGSGKSDDAPFPSSGEY